MFGILAAIFFAAALVGACSVIAHAFRQNMDLIADLLKDYAEIGGASSEPRIISAQMLTSVQPKIAPYQAAATGLVAASRKVTRSYRASQKIKCHDSKQLPSARRVAA